MNTGPNTIYASGDLALLRKDSKPIPRTVKQIKVRKPIRKVSKNRAADNRVYTILRKEYLKAHPYCQGFIKMHGLDEGHVMIKGGTYWSQSSTCWVKVPRSTEIHHTRKPKAKYLNDVSTWLAVSRLVHEMIENNKSWARKNGLLQNN